MQDRKPLSLPYATACGRFTLLRLLGAGAAAEVYEAVDTTDGRAVALKAFRPLFSMQQSAVRPEDAAAVEFGAYMALGAAGPRSACVGGGSTLPASHGILHAYSHGEHAHAAQALVAASLRA